MNGYSYDVIRRLTVPVLVLLSGLSAALLAQTSAPSRRPLAPADVADLTKLVMFEDKRELNEPEIARMVKSAHPEVRRRAALAIGRIANAAGRALLASARQDADPDVRATVAFAYGQLKDAEAIGWLVEALAAAPSSPAVAHEAARSLGKIQVPEARAALAAYLTTAAVDSVTAPVVGEALLSIGRFTTRDDITPIVRWVSSPDAEVRWRAAWALFRPNQPAAAPHFLTMADDASGDVRSWAVRRLTAPAIGAAGLDAAATSAKLREIVAKDPDRRVRTEALRALLTYTDDASFAVGVAALGSDDSWIAISAAEGLANPRFESRKAELAGPLAAAGAASRPNALRMTVLTPLITLAPDAALELAAALAHEKSLVVRSAGRTALQRLGDRGAALLAELPAEPAGPAPAPATPPSAPALTEADYRRIVERWVVPDYNGAAKPRTVWTTPKGEIEIELYPGDAPLGLEYLIVSVETRTIIGTEFGRVVPNFVAQQRTIPGAPRLRDEVGLFGLTRANLSWASAGLDTGRPGYTLGQTPQPHNEGNFTALGRVVRGMDVVDRLELGDAITAARMIK